MDDANMTEDRQDGEVEKVASSSDDQRRSGSGEGEGDAGADADTAEGGRAGSEQGGQVVAPSAHAAAVSASVTLQAPAIFAHRLALTPSTPPPCSKKATRRPSGGVRDAESPARTPSFKATPAIGSNKASPDLKVQDAETRKYQAMIEMFDRKYKLKMEPRIERWKLEGEEEIDGLLEQMLSKDQQEVADAATRLRQIITGDDAAASAVRIKLLATPLAIDTICQSIIMAEELWEVVYPFGVTVRAASNQKSNRIGNLPIGTQFSVTSISLGWLKLKRPPFGFPEGWVRIGAAGKEQVVRLSDDGGKVAVMDLLMTLSQLRHMCLELPRSELREASHRLLNQLRVSRTLLHAWPAAPGRRVENSRSMHFGGAIHAPELHALRTDKGRRPPTPSGTAGASHQEHGPGEAALTRHQRPHSTQPDGWYGTGIHSIIAPPPVTSLRAYTNGIRLPMANLERRAHTLGGPLHVAADVSTFDWAS